MMDKGASVIAKLKNKAKETGKPLQVHLQLFCQEEFLRKLSMSKYADNLVLKGGLFIYTLTNFESRATIDVDFLMRQLPNSIEEIEKIVLDILSVDTGNDFIELTAKAFETISPQRKYTGVSFQIIGKIKNTRTPFSVDLGIGDIIVPKAEKRVIPVQLDEFTKPEISTYSLESTIAEKFDAMLQRLEMTSRMKDFYDIYYLSNMFDFDGRKLQEAIYETLQNRGTSYSRDSLNQISELANDAEMITKWNYFLRTIKMGNLNFGEVIDVMIHFLSPVWQAILDEDELLKKWDKEKREWV
ncbi:MAG: nucleotidyl transferase AbiEii/AbiGii toxin family protein [Clostridia bacterium]|nr:nucleotidyl transferase AbiEii/AbiGii toxin family protein [Clostridia bacterium]